MQPFFHKNPLYGQDFFLVAFFCQLKSSIMNMMLSEDCLIACNDNLNDGICIFLKGDCFGKIF